MKTLNQYDKQIDLFDGEQPDSWRRNYWKEKLKNPDVVQKISEEINSASTTAPTKQEKQDDFFYAGSTVETVLKPRNLHEESKDFFKDQLDLTKDGLPKETMGQNGTTVDSDRVRLDLFDQQWHRNSDFAAKATLKDGKMTMTPTEAFIEVYPHGKQTPVSAAQKPTSSITDGIPANHKGGVRGDDGGVVDSIQLEEKSGASVPIGDRFLPAPTQDGKLPLPANPQISSGNLQAKAWDGQKYDDGGFQGGLGTNLGDLLQKYIQDKGLNFKQEK